MSASVDRRHFTRFVNGLIMKNFRARRIFFRKNAMPGFGRADR